MERKQMATNHFIKTKANQRLEKALMFRAVQLRNWRKLRGLTKTELANLLACHSNTIYLWENGKIIPAWAIERLVGLGFPPKQAGLEL